MSPDPLGGNIQNPQSLNRYTYVLNNPETFVDPLGQWVCGWWTYSNPGADQYESGTMSCAGGGGPGASAGGGAALLEWGWNGQPYMPNAYEYSFALKFAAKLILDKLRASQNAGQSPQSQAHPYLTCVANSGNEASLQGLLGLGKSKTAGAFLGNPLSDGIQFFAGGGSAAAAVGDAASVGTPAALKAVPNVSVSYTSTTVTASPSELTVIKNEISAFLPLGDIATGAAGVLEGFTKLVQIPVDITATGFGAVVCAAGPPGG